MLENYVQAVKGEIMKLSKLEKVDSREVWKHETFNFTPLACAIGKGVQCQRNTDSTKKVDNLNKICNLKRLIKG